MQGVPTFRISEVQRLRTNLGTSNRRTRRVSCAVRAGATNTPLKVQVAQFIVDLVPGEHGLRALSKAFPEKIRGTFCDLLDSYKSQMLIATKDEMAASVLTTYIFKDMVKAYAGQLLGTPYEFPSYHRAIRAPYDYFQMANMYIGSLIDFERSIMRYPDRWTTIQSQLDGGENVVLFANHQSEGDAAFIPLFTELTHPGLGQRVTYVAGDRVVSDLLAKPFSMGKDLLCVHSKKHMNDIPEEKSKKMKQNLATVKEMQRLLNKGGMLIWIAPAGGRDRRGADGTLYPDKFDPQAIEMMRKLGTKPSAAKTHFYPLAMATYDIMPPPASSEKQIGEKRIVNYTGAGLALGEEVVVTDFVDSESLAEYIWQQVSYEYEIIKSCNIPGGGVDELPAESIHPPRAPSIPAVSDL